MRIVRFIVEADTITKDPDSNWLNLKNEDSVFAQFSFSKDWDGFVKVAGFERSNVEFTPKVLIYGYTCEIPKEAFDGTFFRLYVMGKNGSKRKKTRDIIINLNV